MALSFVRALLTYLAVFANTVVGRTSAVTELTPSTAVHASSSVETSSYGLIYQTPSTTSDGAQATASKSDTIVSSSLSGSDFTTEAPLTASQTAPNSCQSNPCYERSVCVDDVAEFFCFCPECFTGRTCNESVDVSAIVMPRRLDAFPDRGPYVGRTNLTIIIVDVAVQVDAAALKASRESYKLCRILLRNASRVVAQTPSLNESVTTELVLSVSVNGTKITWNTGFMFTYKPNPVITDIRPNSILLRGCTNITVLGISLDVINSEVTYEVTNCVGIHKSFVSTEPCVVHNESTMFCRTPNASICEATSSDYRNPQSVTLGNANLHTARLSFVFGGYSQYLNISELGFLSTNLSAYIPPVLQQRHSRTQYRRGELLEIKGEHLNLGVTVEDYAVYVGVNKCQILEDSFSASVFSCRPPDLTDEESASFKSDVYPIKVHIGSCIYDNGEMTYRSSFTRKIVISASFAGALLVVIVVIVTPVVIIIYRSRRRAKPSADYFNLHPPIARIDNFFRTAQTEDGMPSDCLRAESSNFDYHELGLFDRAEPGHATAAFFRRFFETPTLGRRRNSSHNSRGEYGTDADYVRAWLAHGDDRSEGEAWLDADIIGGSHETGRGRLNQWLTDGKKTLRGGKKTQRPIDDTQTWNMQWVSEDPVYVNTTPEINHEANLYENLSWMEHEWRIQEAASAMGVRSRLADQQNADERFYETSRQKRTDRRNVDEAFHVDIPPERIHFRLEEVCGWRPSRDGHRLDQTPPNRRRLPRIVVTDGDISDLDSDIDLPGVVYVNQQHKLTTMPSFKRALTSKPSYKRTYINMQ